MIMGKFYYNAILVITTRYQLFNPEAAWEKLNQDVYNSYFLIHY